MGRPAAADRSGGLNALRGRRPPHDGANQATPLLHSRAEARRLLGGMGKTWLHEQIKAGRLRIVKLGTRTLIPDSEIRRIAGGALQEGVK